MKFVPSCVFPDTYSALQPIINNGTLGSDNAERSMTATAHCFMMNKFSVHKDILNPLMHVLLYHTTCMHYYPHQYGEGFLILEPIFKQQILQHKYYMKTYDLSKLNSRSVNEQLRVQLCVQVR